MWRGGQELTRSFGHFIATDVTITGRTVEMHKLLTMLPLLVQLIPHDTIGLDHVNHRLQFRVQFHKGLGRGRHTIARISIRVKNTDSSPWSYRGKKKYELMI